MITPSDIQNELIEQGQYVLLDYSESLGIARKLVEIYIEKVEKTDSDVEQLRVDDVREMVIEDSEFQKILKKKKIRDITLSEVNDDLSISIDRDLSEFGPFDADVVIDGYYSKLGRLGSEVAQLSLADKKVAVINAENIVRTGSPDDLMDTYRDRREAGSDSGPYYPKRPDNIVKLAIRGMLPHKTKRGRKALSNIRIYLKNPYDRKGKMLNHKTSLDVYSTQKGEFMTIGEIARKLGWKGLD